MSSSCHLEWGVGEDSTGPLGIDYAYLYECSPSGLNPIIILLYFLWIFYLITLLAQTASNYLSPTLSKICEKLHVAYDVAGVTFLAFGNGAPDFFSLIASFSGGVDILVGVGALLGGSMFVCTVVVGSIAILSPCEVSKRIFVRDVSFHILAISLVLIISCIQVVYMPMAFVLLIIYVVYVLMVVVSSNRDAALARVMGDIPLQPLHHGNGHAAFPVESMEIQTAFWHIDSTVAKKQAQEAMSKAKKPAISTTNSTNYRIASHQYTPATSLTSTVNANSNLKRGAYSALSTEDGQGDGGAGGSKGYSFLLLTETRKPASTGPHVAAGGGSNASDDEEEEDDSEDSKFQPFGKDNKKTINISGAFALDVDRILKENYYSADGPESGRRIMVGDESAGGIVSTNKSASSGGAMNPMTRRTPSTSSAVSTFVIEGDQDDDDHDNTTQVGINGTRDLESSLLGDQDDVGDLEGGGMSNVQQTYQYSRMLSSLPRNNALNSWKIQRYSSSVLTSMYWQQWSLRRGLRHRLTDDWRAADSVTSKALVIAEAPATMLRDLTIPTLEISQWSKTVAMCHPLVAPLFVLYILGALLSISALDFFLCLCLCSAASLCIYLGTNQSRPPEAVIFVTVWTLSAFAMCVFWIYALAGELITVLSVLGRELRLPPAFLGLTVLAWGNSVGDLFTNTAVAKQGLGTMALAGCYAGPVFNLLVGFGTSLLYACSQSYPKPFHVQLDPSSIMSLVFILIALSSTIILVPLRGYRMDRPFGMYLLALYGAYSFGQAILVLSLRG